MKPLASREIKLISTTKFSLLTDSIKNEVVVKLQNSPVLIKKYLNEIESDSSETNDGSNSIHEDDIQFKKKVVNIGRVFDEESDQEEESEVMSSVISQKIRGIDKLISQKITIRF